MEGYIARRVVKESKKAYLVEVHYNNRRDGCGIKYKWIAKSLCKPVMENEYSSKWIYTPENIIGSGVW